MELPLGQAAAAPSPWVRRFAALIPDGGSVLDVACGSGRHLRWLAEQGPARAGPAWRLFGVDRDAAALEPLRGLAELTVADIESQPWPYGARRFDAVIVTNYLWRPLYPTLLAALAEGGVLIHETFAHGQHTIGRPARPEFLLLPGELLRLCAGLRVVAFEDGFEPGGDGFAPRFVQRICAVHRPADAGSPARYPLRG